MSYKPTVDELTRLIGNPDAYAVQHEDGTWHPVREPLTRSVLRQHRAGKLTVGTYFINPPDQAHVLVFDIDADNELEAKLDLSRVTDVIHSIGEFDYMVEFSGKKGFHVWVVADDWMPAETLLRLGRGIREEAGLPKLEVYPKQTFLDPKARTRRGGTTLGNLVKLPGGVHAVTGQANNIVSDHFVRPTRPTLLEGAASLYPEVSVARTRSGPATMEYPCVCRIQEGAQEGGRNNQLFHLATMLRRWSLSEENIETIIRRANEKSDPPLDDAELQSILESSANSGPICGQLPDEVHCGEQCIQARHQGLYTRTGSLKWSQPGDKVVVEVKSRSDDGHVIELEHDDLTQGRVILREPGRANDGN